MDVPPLAFLGLGFLRLLGLRGVVLSVIRHSFEVLRADCWR